MLTRSQDNSTNISNSIIQYAVSAIPGVAIVTIPIVLGFTPEMQHSAAIVAELALGTVLGPGLIWISSKEKMSWQQFGKYAAFDFLATISTFDCNIFSGIPKFVPPLVGFGLPTLGLAAHKFLSDGAAKKIYEKLTKHGFAFWRSEPQEVAVVKQDEEAMVLLPSRTL